VTLKPGSLKVIGTDTCRSATYDFLLTFHSNHGPISFSEIMAISVDNRKIFSPPCILHPCRIGFRRLESS